MEPEKKKPGACPPRAGLNPHFLHTAVLKGIAVFFLFDRLFPFPWALPIIRQKPTAERVHQKVCALFLCREMQISVISR